MEVLRPVAPPPLPEKDAGLAIASLVLGILGVIMSFALIGIVLGLIGLLFGSAYLLRQRAQRKMALAGIVLGALGILLGSLCAAYYSYLFSSFSQDVLDSLQDIQDKMTQWEGVPAPDFSISTLDGQTITLNQLKGKRVVLHFWATSSAYSRREIPHFVQLTKEIPPKDLVIVGICQEERNAIENFLERNNINYALALKTDLPAPYSDVRSIPTTFFIDRKGVIQAIHTGYSDYETLLAEATAPDYAGPLKTVPETTIRELAQAENPLTPVTAWTVTLEFPAAFCCGDWDSDLEDEILFSDYDAKLHILGRDGEERESISLPQEFHAIELGHHRESGPRLLGYNSIGGRKIVVMDRTGKKLWSYWAWFGVEKAHWGDLDGDGTDEIIFGMMSLRALSADGSALWKRKMGFPASLAVVSAQDNQPARIFTIDLTMGIRSLDSKGQKIVVFQPMDERCSHINAARMDSSGTIQVIEMASNISGAEDNTGIIVCDETGRVAWTAHAEEDAQSWSGTNFVAGDVTGDGVREWIFRESNTKLVIASAQGQRLCDVPIQEDTDDFAVAGDPAGKGFLIVLDKQHRLTAYRFE